MSLYALGRQHALQTMKVAFDEGLALLGAGIGGGALLGAGYKALQTRNQEALDSHNMANASELAYALQNEPGSSYRYVANPDHWGFSFKGHPEAMDAVENEMNRSRASHMGIGAVGGAAAGAIGGGLLAHHLGSF